MTRHLHALPIALLLVAPPGALARGRIAARTSAPASQPAAVPGEAAFSSCLRLPGARQVKVTLKPQSSLAELVGWISGMTCKRFVLGASLQAQTVTLVSPTPITAGEAYRAFLSALEVQGLTVVPAGGLLKVVPSGWAQQSGIPTYRHQERRRLPESDQVVTQLVRLQEARVDEVLPVLHKLKSRAGDVASYAPTATLIITDHASNVRRLVKIVEELDLPLGQAGIWVVRPRHADAGELARVLGELFGATGGGASAAAPAAARAALRSEGEQLAAEPAAGARSPAARVLADSGSNALVIVASEPVYERMLALVRTLDVEGEGARAQAWVYRLKHADAEQVARSLSGLGIDGLRPPRRAGTAVGGAPASLFEGQIKITADKPQNAILVLASAQDFLRLRRMLVELDEPRRQVYIEAYIMEVKLDRDRNLGFSYHGGQLAGEKRDTTVLGSLGHDGLSSLLGVPLGGMSVGVLGPKLEGSGALLGKGPDGKALPEVPAFGVVFNAMQANGDLDLLSAPHLLTMDNEEAELHVGEIIPVRTGASSLGTAGAQLGALATLIPPGVDRKDVGVKLKLTPTVGAGDSVRLKLRQEVSDVVAEDFGGLGAKTSQRLISTNVTLRDRQTIAIGGLMSDHRSKTVSKVPLLGDIPILGRLFQRERVVTRKTNLLVVLTPHIVRDAADLTTMLRAKLRERQEFVRRFLGRQERLGLRAIDYRYKRGLLGELAALSSTLDEEAARHGEGAAARGPSAVRVRPRPPASRPAE